MSTDGPKNITGVILCGGTSSRMGINKALLEYQGVRLIDRVVSVMRGLFEELILVTNTPRVFADLDAEIVTDVIQGKGAIGGLHSGLFYASRDSIFLCACDMPFIDPTFISYMIRRYDKHDIVVPRTKGGREPLHAIYSRRCLGKIERELKEGRLKIYQLFDLFKTLEIKPEESDAHRGEDREKIFFNVNTLEDWEKINENV